MSPHEWTVRAWAENLPLSAPFSIATQTWDVAANVFVTVRNGGNSGIGEVSPDPRWGDSQESVLAEVESVQLSSLEGPFDIEGVAALLEAGAARCALDIAMHDLAAKLAGVSVAELLGVGSRSLPFTSLTLPIDDVDAMVARAQSLADHPVLKMKVGFDGDVDAVAAVRRVFSGTLRVDANEGWEPAQAIERLPALEALDIELCEQPIERGRLDELERVTKSTRIPVFADEDVGTARDVARLVGKVDGVNLKLRKTGGIREALRAVATARAHGMGVMLGCDLTSGVAATAEASLAALVDHADIDGPLLLADDPYPGVAYRRGVMTLPRGPGLGVRGAVA